MSSKTSVFYVNHRNNVVDNRLTSRLEEYEKEYVYNIRRLDNDKVHLRRVLKDIYRCHSDSDPAVKYLENGNANNSLYRTYRQYSSERLHTTAPAAPPHDSTKPLPVIPPAKQKASRPVTQPNYLPTTPRRGLPTYAVPSTTSRGLPNIAKPQVNQTQCRKLSSLKSHLPKIDEQSTPTRSIADHDPTLQQRSKTMPVEGSQSENLSVTTSVTDLSSIPASESRRSLLSSLTGGHRGRSKSKIEMDLIQRILRERNRRHKINATQIRGRVQRFCKNIEEYTLKQKIDAEPVKTSLAF